MITTVPSFHQFADHSNTSLATIDIVELNLSCAVGLPGTDDLDIAACCTKKDQWADLVAYGTRRLQSRFDQQPEDYNHSEAYYRILVMVTVLQRNLGVQYNPERIHNPDYADPRDLFVHGLLTGHGGTCVSMPVLYLAIGRRLGYPLRLVQAKAHLFLRWDDPATGERFNIEATSQGLNCHPDEHYRQWPHTITEAEVAASHYLSSLIPREELAAFLAARGHCLHANGRLAEAAGAYDQACKLHPQDPNYAGFRAMSAVDAVMCETRGLRSK
ncbi:MAG: transglutaminase-like domain-containing protein [Planctomycetes bacterium]|nr:transglutaminase-like domain-containing protein [Planctomycetota bacterium]